MACGHSSCRSFGIFIGITELAALPLGIIALVRDRKQGRPIGMAIASVVISGLFVAIWLVIIFIAIAAVAAATAATDPSITNCVPNGLGGCQ